MKFMAYNELEILRNFMAYNWNPYEIYGVQLESLRNLWRTTGIRRRPGKFTIQIRGPRTRDQHRKTDQGIDR